MGNIEATSYGLSFSRNINYACSLELYLSTELLSKLQTSLIYNEFGIKVSFCLFHLCFVLDDIMLNDFARCHKKFKRFVKRHEMNTIYLRTTQEIRCCKLSSFHQMTSNNIQFKEKCVGQIKFS